MPAFMEPSDEEKMTALQAMPDAQLIGSHWSTAPLASLTTSERRRLVNYRYGTFGFEQYCDQLVARRGRTTEELYNLRRVLDRWHAAFRDLRTWQYSENVERAGDALNPVGKVLKYEEASISTVRSQLTD